MTTPPPHHRRLSAIGGALAGGRPSQRAVAAAGPSVKVTKVGIIMNGVTGRMGTNQHLLRSLVPIIVEGGLPLAGGTELLLPELCLVGRTESKLAALAEQAGVPATFTTDLDSVLADPAYTVYFDAQTTGMRAPSVRKAVAAGKHIYAEKPVADTTAHAIDLAELCEAAGVKNGPCVPASQVKQTWLRPP